MFLAASCAAYTPHAFGQRVAPMPAAVSVRMETPCDTRYGGFEPDWLIDGVKAVREKNDEVLPLLQDLRERRFFRLYAADLLASCSYMPTAEEPCELGECEVDAVDEVPDELKERDESESEFELDSWARWDQPSDFTEYYDLVENAEGHTGYDGSDVWRFIHAKISFQKGIDLPGNEFKAEFNRAVSGVHACVSAQIVEGIEEEDPEKALDEYRRRLRDEPEAVPNLLFTYMLTLCAIDKSRERLESCSYLGEGVELLPTMKKLTASALVNDAAVQNAATNLIRHADSAEEASWKLRMRTRDLLRIMNCVQCNICRLHGKVKALGLAAALEVLLGIQGRGEDCNKPADPATSIAAGRRARHACAKLSAACATVERYEALDAAAAAGTRGGRRCRYHERGAEATAA